MATSAYPTRYYHTPKIVTKLYAMSKLGKGKQ